MTTNALLRTSHGLHAHMLQVQILVFVYVGFFAVVWASTTEIHNTWLCLHCTGVDDPSDCNAFRICQEPMICFATSYVTPSGRVLYDMGCKHALNLANPTFAPSTALPSLMTLPAGSDRKRYLCDRLCFSHFCNYRLCPSYKSRKNIRCVSCSEVSHPSRCEKLRTCSSYEVCMYQNYVNDLLELQYSMGCVNKQVCGINNGGKRQLARNCCDTDFCNMVSALGVASTSSSPILTSTPTSATTASTTTIPSAVTSPTTASTTATRPTQQITNGPICLSCQSFSQRKGCITLAVCPSDQECYLSVNQSTKGLTYSSGCTPKTLCSGFGSTLIGKRSKDSIQMTTDATVQRCFQCCDFNFCNYDLCSSIFLSTLVG
ncbi:uncharacterized protein [Haliotis asinina]|uniref:uncharacterized protein isoform X1 n=1 Tax=Haliotis asinina TaxID=109174 RepID=UPI0035318FCE